MKRMFVLCLLALAFTPVATAPASAACYRPNCWGAIAINTETRIWTWVVNHPSAGVARQYAIARCNGGCNRVLVFRNSCAAYALAGNGGWGWASGHSDRSGAERHALFECSRHNPGQGCQVRVFACTSR